MKLSGWVGAVVVGVVCVITANFVVNDNAPLNDPNDTTSITVHVDGVPTLQYPPGPRNVALMMDKAYAFYGEEFKKYGVIPELLSVIFRSPTYLNSMLPRVQFVFLDALQYGGAGARWAPLLNRFEQLLKTERVPFLITNAGARHMDHKGDFEHILRRASLRSRDECPHKDLSMWTPMTWDLYVRDECEAFQREMTLHPDTKYFLKHTHGAKGKDIFVLNQKDETLKDFVKEWSPSGFCDKPLQFVAQRNVEPLLSRGVKFDLRIHFTFPSITPLMMYSWNGSIRRSWQPYNIGASEGVTTHTAPHGEDRKYPKMDGKLDRFGPIAMTSDDYQLWLKDMEEEHGIADMAKQMEEWEHIAAGHIFFLINSVLRDGKELQAVETEILSMGCDFLPSTDGKLYLIEVNVDAAFENTVEQTPGLLSDLSDLYYYTNMKKVQGEQELAVKVTSGKVKLLFDGSKNTWPEDSIVSEDCQSSINTKGPKALREVFPLPLGTRKM